MKYKCEQDYFSHTSLNMIQHCHLTSKVKINTLLFYRFSDNRLSDQQRFQIDRLILKCQQT